MIKVLFLHRQLIILEGMKAFLNMEKGIELHTTRDFHITEKYDIYIIDINLIADDIEQNIIQFKSVNEDSKFILYINFESKIKYYHLILNDIIDGIISDNDGQEYIYQLITAVKENNILLDTDFIEYINHRLYKIKLNFNTMEKRIIQLVVEGLTNRAIALELSVSQRTVEKYLTRIYSKLDITNRVELVIVASKNKII